MNEKLYSLLVSGDETAWESDTYILDIDRCLREYTEKDLVQRFSILGESEIDELRNLPCIFAYEERCEKDAYVGNIVNIMVRQKGIRITFQKIEVLSFETLNKLRFELDIMNWELNRTHWAIKKVDLYKELQQAGIKLSNTTKKLPVDITKHHFDISFTFAGESRGLVEQVVNELGLIRNLEHVFYDNNFISQLARPNLDILLQDIYRNRSKLIVVFLCEKYQEKRWCGLEFRAIREMIMEKATERIMYIRLDEGRVDGVFNTDGYVDGNKFSSQKLADFINERFALLS